jgi:cytochrome P450
MKHLPSVDVDLFGDDVLAEPYETYRYLRSIGDVVYVSLLDMWFAPRYSSVREVLGNHKVFTSADGVGFDSTLNGLRKGSVLASDPPEHARLRKVLSDDLGPRHLRHLAQNLQHRADALVDHVIEQGRVDAVADFASKFPVSVVADLIGLPAEGRDNLLGWADGAFNSFGNGNQRTQDGLGGYFQIRDHIVGAISRETLRPNSMGIAVFDAADRGDIDEGEAINLLTAYLTAGMDTTVNAIGHSIWLLGTHADQWDLLRGGTVQVSDAINEIVRFEPPVYAFSRGALIDHEFDSARIPAGSRIGVLFGSANRDERKWHNADTFDLTRAPSDHVGFGYGIHSCAGQGLARMELQALLTSLISRVKTIEVGEPRRRINNIVRGLESLPMQLFPR